MPTKDLISLKRAADKAYKANDFDAYAAFLQAQMLVLFKERTRTNGLASAGQATDSEDNSEEPKGTDSK